MRVIAALLATHLGRVDDVNDPAAQPGSGLEPVAEVSEPSEPASDDAEPTA